MAVEYTHKDLAVHGRLVHEDLTAREREERGPNGQPAPAYEIGVVIEGVFVPLLSKRSAAGLFADIERAKAEQAKSSEQG